MKYELALNFMQTIYFLMFLKDSTAIGDLILEQLGIPPPQSHWLHIFGSVYKLNLPKEDILTVQQWEEHKKSAIFKSLLSLIIDDMKFKVSELSVKLVRSKNDEQNRIIEPFISSRSIQQTETDVIQPDAKIRETNDAKIRETTDFSQQYTNQKDIALKETGNNTEKSKISMVFG